jgi:hypothetical protein
MVVHVEHALLALRTVMATFGFEVVANEAKFALIWVLIIESPHNGNPSWVCDCDCDEGPNAHCVEEGCDGSPPYRPFFALPDEEFYEIHCEDDNERYGDADEVWVIEWEIFARSQYHVLIL